VRVNFYAELDLFDLGGVLMLFGFLFPLGLFEAELAVIHDPAHRRRGRRRDLHQVQAERARLGERLAEREDAKLVTVRSDDADFAGANFPVDPRPGAERRKLTRREGASQGTPPT
jgi:hypothetical protein